MPRAIVSFEGPPLTELAKSAQNVPREFEFSVRLPIASIPKELGSSREVSLVDRRPRAAEKRRRFLLMKRAGGFVLVKAPRQIRSPGDEAAGELQTLELHADLTEANEGQTRMALLFRWRISRTGYLSLWPFTVLAVGAWVFYGVFGLMPVVLGFVVLHWPRDVRERRLELVSKISESLGQHLVESDAARMYR